MDAVGRYQILEELGQGAHGVVYKALDPAIGRTIAIKKIAIGEILFREPPRKTDAPDGGSDPSGQSAASEPLPSAFAAATDREPVREKILGEARLAGTLSHPNVVAVFDVVDSEDAVFIVMEFVDGESMEAAITALRERRPGLLTRANFISLLKQVAQGLDYAHRKGVVHRDVKPANIMLKGQKPDQTSELVAKIADFGVAKFASHEITRPLGAFPTMVGTPNYMSPEQAEGITVTGASDQFSLASIAYEVLTGQKAFTADSLDVLLFRIRTQSEEAVSILNRSLSPTVSKVMLRALSKKPEDRFQNCAEFAGALEFALGDSPNWTPGMLGDPMERMEIPAPMQDGEFRPPEEEKRWGTRLALLLALGLAVCLALVLIVRMNSGSDVPTQVLDSKSAPASPPPEQSPPIDELKLDRRAASDNSPTFVKVPDLPALPPVAKPAAAPVLKKQQSVRAVKQTAPLEVQFSTDPPNANVLVDGNNACETPCSLTLSPGRHTMTASLSGYGMARRIFNVPQDASLFVPLGKSEGVLLVSSQPTGAAVNVDGRSAGTTPVTLRLTPGTHQVSVYDGSRWHEESVVVASDEVRTRLFRF